MIRRILRTTLFVLPLLVLQSAAGAVKVGDAAPRTLPGTWVQGEAVKEFEGDKVYIVEFWATWCGPCVAAIPHVNDIYKKHKSQGLVVIGQNLGEDQATVSSFVKKMGSKMTYRVTADDGAGTMAKKWLEAAGQSGIPCAFVVSKSGKLAYIGHPMEMEESMLEKLLAEPSTKAAESPAGRPSDASLAPSPKAAELAKLAAVQIQQGKLDDAETTIADLNDNLTENFRHIGALLELDLLLARGQEGDAVRLSKLLTEDFAGKTTVLNAVAAHLVMRNDAGKDLQDAAELIASPLAKADGEGRCAALSTLARIAFQRGDQARALELQKQAVTAASPAEKDAAESVLDTYQKGKLP